MKIHSSVRMLFFVVFLCMGCAVPCFGHAQDTKLTSKSIALHEGWELQSGCKIQDTGAQLSSVQYQPQGWIKTAVPSTVLAAQVAAGIYKDPYFGINLAQLPGDAPSSVHFFANAEMPADSPYRCAWWYRKQFQIPATAQGKTVWLHFEGINYRANIWVNGKLIADSQHVAGAYRVYDLDITKAVTAGQVSAIAIETFAPGPLDLGINWVDWNPTPPDKDMGLFGGVNLVITGPVALRHPSILTHFEDDSLGTAEITVVAEVQNATDDAIQGTLSGTLEGIPFHQPVQLSAGESKTVTFSPQQFPQLKVKNPAIWWPVEMGSHPLETLTMQFANDGRVSDQASARVGIREASSELTPTGARLFRINRKPILIRGGGWSQDMMMRTDHENLQQQIRMVNDLHLNTIRQEGKLETEQFYRLTDESGILVMAGWCCCDQWEHWDEWTAENHHVAVESLRSQILRLREHPSLLVWLNGSDKHPPADVEQAYLDVEKETYWPNATLSSASGGTSTLTGPGGVKMTGPYNYVSPSYWYADNMHGSAFSFNTETSPGPAIPQPDSLVKFLSPQDHWPIDKVWEFHAGRGSFGTLNIFNNGMNATYGPADSMEEYSRISQTMTYDGERAMFEAFARNKYTSTGVIQWMLNNAWPSIIWHLYDYYMQTGGGYFGTKKACEPLHVQYSYDDHSIYAVSSLPIATSSLTVQADVYDFNLKPVFHGVKIITLNADASQRIFDIPDSVFQPDPSVYFVRLQMKNGSGKIISRNFYWIPSKMIVSDLPKVDGAHTEPVAYSNMQALRTLPKSQVRATLTTINHILHVHLENTSHALAFQLQVRGFSANGSPIIPLLWSDDFIELMPGEQRDLDASLPEDVSSDSATVEVSGWNLDTITLDSKPATHGSGGKN